ncbi:MAG TPA: MtrB/PioB family outer membrane beta-barrel protein [Terriglobales bacterium]|nr:MtrB/PioB family outer membrane beta-barrel protein [Terriglobales bacterium]
MMSSKRLVALAFFPLLIIGGVFAQDKRDDKGTSQKGESSSAGEGVHGMVEFGVRALTGDVYGRPDLRTGQCLGCGTPFDPRLSTSKLNEYRDVRDGFYVPRLDLRSDKIFGTRFYAALQSQKAIYRDQSYLLTFGEYGKFRLQFRYDEIPHIYSNTTRTLYTETAPGVWSFPAAIRASLQAAAPANLPSLIAGTGAFAAGGATCGSSTNCGVVTNANFITPAIVRKAGTASFSYDLNERWNLNAMFWREHQTGLRPIGLIMNSSPSASATSGFGVELPETIDYFNNLVRVGTDYGKRAWSVQAAYIGSFFQNNIHNLTWDNPFRLDTETSTTPLTGRMDLYPDNQAHYLNFAGAADVTRYLRFMASITPGWLRQDDRFLPYTTNSADTTGCGDGTQDCTSTASLPAPSLSGNKHTLAMNYTLVTTAWKRVQLKAGYRQYDYNNNTRPLLLTPVQGDAQAPSGTPAVFGEEDSTPFGYDRKTVEVTGEWFFGKKSLLKAGYLGDWMDRSHRDAAHSLENTFLTSVDWVPTKDLLFRASYSHSDRKPDSYQDDNASDPTTGLPVTCADTGNVTFTADQRCHRRFDEAQRVRDRADGFVEYSPTANITLTGFAGTVQDNYNRRGGTNSSIPLNFLTGSAATTGNYYLYGLLKDISYNYGLDVDYAVLPQATFFAEYSYEKYHKRMITRYRTPVSAPGTILTCNGCDTPNNDWESVSHEPVNIYTAGLDTHFGKKTYFSTYYSLSAGVGHVDSRPLGDATITAPGPDQFLLTGTNAAVNYPETVNRNHELTVIFRYKLTEHVSPKIEYRYQQWDYKDYQTTPMTQYMGCISPIPNGPPPAPNAVPGCGTPMLTSNTPNPVGVPSAFYPGYVVGDTSAARYLFLGVDQPSYHAHTVTATIEFSF